MIFAVGIQIDMDYSSQLLQWSAELVAFFFGGGGEERANSVGEEDLVEYFLIEDFFKDEQDVLRAVTTLTGRGVQASFVSNPNLFSPFPMKTGNLRLFTSVSFPPRKNNPRSQKKNTLRHPVFVLHVFIFILTLIAP